MTCTSNKEYVPCTTFAGENPFVATKIKSSGGRSLGLSLEQVRAIRAMRSAGIAIKEIYLMFKVDRTTVSNVINYKNSYKDAK